MWPTAFNDTCIKHQTVVHFHLNLYFEVSVLIQRGVRPYFSFSFSFSFRGVQPSFSRCLALFFFFFFIITSRRPALFFEGSGLIFHFHFHLEVSCLIVRGARPSFSVFVFISSCPALSFEASILIFHCHFPAVLSWAAPSVWLLYF